MKTHELKTWPEYFKAIVSQEKMFELRKNDRGFQVGDTLKLMEYDPAIKQYTGNFMLREVTYIVESTMFGLKKGFCVLGIR